MGGPVLVFMKGLADFLNNKITVLERPSDERSIVY